MTMVEISLFFNVQHPTIPLSRIGLRDAVKILALEITQQHEQVTILDIFEFSQDCNNLDTSMQALEQQAAQRWYTYDTARRLGHASKQEAHRIITRHDP
jgi:hypothetical protein